MKASLKLRRNPFFSKVAAVFLIIPLILQMNWPAAVAESAGILNSATPEVHVFFGDTEIHNGMVIDPTGFIHTRYSFSATLNELAGTENTVVLPKRIKAAYAMSEPITITGSQGTEVIIGELNIDEKLNVMISFLDLPDSTDNGSATPGDNESGDENSDNESATSGDIESGGENSDNESATSGDIVSGGENADNESATSGDIVSGGENADNESATSGDIVSGGENAGGGSATSGDIESGSENADNGSATPGDNEPGELLPYIFRPEFTLLSTVGGTEDGDDIIDPEATDAAAAIGPDESITVVFDIPVEIVTAGLPVNEDGSYTVELESGGDTVSVTVLSLDTQTATQPVVTPAATAAFGLPVRNNVRLAAGALFKDVVTLTPYSTPSTSDPIDAPSSSNPYGINLYLLDPAGEYHTTSLATYALLNNSTASHTVSSSSSFILSYDFGITQEQAEAIYANLKSTPKINTYPLQIPDGLKASPVNIDIVLKVDISLAENAGSSTAEFGILHIDTNGNASVEFLGDFWDNAPSYYWTGTFDFKGHFNFGCKLDMSDIGAEEKYRIILNDGSTIDLDIADNNQEDVLDKAGILNADKGIITWTVKYTAGAHRYLPVVFTDNFEHSDEFEFENLKVQYNSSPAVTLLASDKNTKGFVLNGDGFEYTIDSSNAQSLGITSTRFVNNKTVYVLNPQDKIVFTYQTHVTGDTYATSGATTILNGAQIAPDTSTPSTATYPVTIKPEDKKWLPTKKYTQNGTAAHWNEIQWTVTVKVRDTDVKNLKFYDYIDEEIDTITSVKVTCNEPPTPSTTLTKDAATNGYKLINSSDPALATVAAEYGITTPGSSDVLTFDFPKKDANNYYNSYTVTYNARIKEQYFVNIATPPVITNIAWLDFEWPEDGPVVPDSQYMIGVETDDTKVGPGNIDTKIIHKSGAVVTGSYSSAGTTVNAYYIDWTIEVNRYELEITGGKITDELQDYLKYVPSTLKIATSAISGASKVVYSNTSGAGTTKGDGTAFFKASSSTTVFTYDFPPGYNSKDKIVINFRTQIDESKFSGNPTTGVSTIRFNNEARFDGTVKYSGGTATVGDTAVAEPTKSSSVVNKTVNSSYDYSTHKLTWMVEVNRNKIAMLGDVVLADTFGSWLKNIDSVRLYTSLSKTSEIIGGFTVKYPNPANNDYKLEIVFPGQAGKHNPICSGKTVFVFITAVVDLDSDEVKAALTKTGSASFLLGNNTVEMRWTPNTGQPATNSSTVNSGSIINNNMLAKTADTTTSSSGYDPTTNKITYNVKVNPVGLSLNGCYLTDVIPPQLSLDLNSVELYKAVVSADGKSMVKGARLNITGYSWSYVIEQDPAVRQILRVNLPTASDAYILVYACDVLEYGKISNGVTLYGFVENQGITNNNSVQVDSAAWATGRQKSATAALTIEKVNSLNESIKIKGITFELYAKVGDNAEFLLQKQTTDSDGKITFTGLVINSAIKYRLKEIDSADETGYECDTAIVTIINDTEVLQLLDQYYFPIDEKVITLQISNRPVSHDVEFLKINDDGGYLTGAVFTITGEVNKIQYTDEATSDNGVVRFKKVPVGTSAKTYTLKEKTPSINYLLDTKTYELTIQPDGKYRIYDATKSPRALLYDSENPKGDKWTIVNPYDPSSRAIRTDVYFKKINDIFLSRLNGATFQITEDLSVLSYVPPGYIPYKAVATSTGDGLVTFRNIPVGRYLLEEIAPTPHYWIYGESYILTVNRDRTFTIADQKGIIYNSDPNNLWELENTYKYDTRDPEIPISFKKVRNGVNSKPLGGAVFRIDEDPNYRPVPPSLNSYTATSTDAGLVIFNDVHIGLYTLREVSAPTGFRRDTTIYTLIVYAGGTYRIVNPNGNTVYDSSNPTAFPNLWTVKNTLIDNSGDSGYSGGGSGGSGGSGFGSRALEDSALSPVKELMPDPQEDTEELTASDLKSNADTGDDSNLILWLSCFFSASILLAALLYVKRRRKKQWWEPDIPIKIDLKL